jgi:uncharacterized protein YkwD
MPRRHPARRPRAAGRIVLVLAAAQLAAAAPTAFGQAIPDPTSVVGAVPLSLPATPRGCASATAQSSSATPDALRAALRCVIDVERTSRGLAPLPADARVDNAASAHARDMVRRHYFSHQRAGGPSPMQRMRRAGWRGHGVGEAIAWGCGSLGTPLATVRAWLNSPPHRAILLDRSWNAGGIGVARQAPTTRCGGGATWVLDAGR